MLTKIGVIEVINRRYNYQVRNINLKTFLLPGRLIASPIPIPGYGGFPVKSAIEVALDLGPLDWLR